MGRVSGGGRAEAGGLRTVEGVWRVVGADSRLLGGSLAEGRADGFEEWFVEKDGVNERAKRWRSNE